MIKAEQIKIRAANNSELENRVVEGLKKAITNYDIDKYIFSDSMVVVATGEIPHSHPIITLNTRHPDDDMRNLATFIHEELHWYIDSKPNQTDKLVSKLRQVYPQVPSGYPLAARSELSTYTHLILCTLEYRCMIELLGYKKANELMQRWKSDVYTWIYKTVEKDYDSLLLLIVQYDLDFS